MVAITLQFLIRAVSDIALSRYLSAVGVTLVIYDWVLLFKVESQTIWPSRWTIPKALYYYIRIVTLPFIIFASYELMDFRPAFSQALCRAWPAIVTIPMFSTFAASNWLFTLRLIALYKRKPWLIWFMRFFYFCTYAASFSMLILALFKYGETVDYFPQIKACGALEASPTFPAMFYAPAAYELLIFALTAHQAYKDASVITDSSSAPFLIVLYRDGLVCFLVMLALRSWNIWLYAAEPISSLNVGVNIFWAVNTILSTRVYLNLVWLVRKPSLSPTLYPRTEDMGMGDQAVRVTTGIRMIPPTQNSTYVWTLKDEGEEEWYTQQQQERL